MNSNFSVCLAETLKWEGGYSNHSKDPGGPTNYGVIQARYDEYNRDIGRPTKSVKQITKGEVDDIYKRYYWDRVGADDCVSGVDLVLFDYGVNSGPGQAIKSAQKVLGVDTDGVLGPVTKKALQDIDPVVFINAYMDERVRFWRSLKIFPTFGKGWLRRGKGIREKALKMASYRHSIPTPTEPLPTPKPTAPLNWFEYLIHKLLASTVWRT